MVTPNATGIANLETDVDLDSLRPRSCFRKDEDILRPIKLAFVFQISADLVNDVDLRLRLWRLRL